MDAMEKMTPKRKPSNLIYGLDDVIPLPILLLLGLQHSFHVTTALIFAMIVLQGMGSSPAQAGFFVSMSLLAGGLAVILQALNRKGIGSGYFAPSVCEPAYIPASLMAAQTGGLPLVLGMTALSGVFEIILSGFIHRLRRIFTPEVMGMVVAMVGISVIPVTTRNFLGIEGDGTAINPTVLTVSMITLGTMVSITVWSRGKLRLFSVIIGMITGYVVSYWTGLLPAAHLQQILAKPLLAIVLTVIFQIGLKKKIALDLEPGKTTSGEILDLLEKQGSLWGARQAVIGQAASALNELLELICLLGLTNKAVCLEMSFDEFNLDLAVRYDGKPLAIDGEYVAPSSVDAEISIAKLSLQLIRKDADRIDVSEKNGQQRILLHFDH